MILEETLKILKEKIDFSKLNIEDMLLGNPDNIIKLNNGSLGIAMNYFQIKNSGQSERLRKFFLKKLDSDPLLLKYLFEKKDNNLLKTSLKVCVIGALSNGLISENKDFEINDNIEEDFFSGINSATVIGFGGRMDMLVEKTNIPKIHISDLFFDPSKQNFKEKIDYFNENFPKKTITFSDGSDNRQRISNSELISITGSALCNNTMEKLLEYFFPKEM